MANANRWCLRFLLFSLAGAQLLAQPRTLTNEWKLELKTAVDSSPAIGHDGTVYFGTFAGRLWAVNPDGTKKWTFTTGRGRELGMEIRSSPAVGPDGTIYFGSRDRNLYAVTAEGKVKWVFATRGWVDSSPALAQDGTIYMGSWDKQFYAVAPDGKQRWAFKSSGEITSSPAIDASGFVYFGSHDGRFYALKPDGTKVWDYQTGGPIISSPAIAADGALYFTSVDGWFHAVNPDGQTRWKLKTGGITESSPVIGLDGRIFVGVNKTIWAISPAGDKVWEQPVTTDAYQQPVSASPTALADGGVLAISGYGWLTAIDADLERKWGFYLKGYGRSSPAMGPDGTVYAAHYHLYAIKPGVTFAKGVWSRFRGNLQNTGCATK